MIPEPSGPRGAMVSAILAIAATSAELWSNATSPQMPHTRHPPWMFISGTGSYLSMPGAGVKFRARIALRRRRYGG
jgi:hypothetical protein